jgi:hypothetical protein
METKESQVTENLEKLKDREIDIEALEDVSGGGDLIPDISNPNSKPFDGALSDYKPRIPQPKKKSTKKK